MVAQAPSQSDKSDKSDKCDTAYAGERLRGDATHSVFLPGPLQMLEGRQFSNSICICGSAQVWGRRRWQDVHALRCTCAVLR